MGGGRCGDPQAARAARASQSQGRNPQPGAGASLVSRQARSALSALDARDRRYRPLPHGEYAIGHSPCRWGFRRLRAARVRRRGEADRATQSGAEFFRRQLRGEGGTLEDAVARDHGDRGRVRCPLYPPRHCEERNDEATQTAAAEAILECFATLAMTVVRAACYRTTPDVNPAFRRGGLISFFRKQRASRPV